MVTTLSPVFQLRPLATQPIPSVVFLMKATSSGIALMSCAASYPRTVDLLRLLLDRGADLRAQDRTNATALALAVRSADVDVD